MKKLKMTVALTTSIVALSLFNIATAVTIDPASYSSEFPLTIQVGPTPQLQIVANPVAANISECLSSCAQTELASFTLDSNTNGNNVAMTITTAPVAVLPAGTTLPVASPYAYAISNTAQDGNLLYVAIVASNVQSVGGSSLLNGYGWTLFKGNTPQSISGTIETLAGTTIPNGTYQMSLLAAAYTP